MEIYKLQMEIYSCGEKSCLKTFRMDDREPFIPGKQQGRISPLQSREG